MYKNKPYRGSRYERNRKIRRIILIIAAVLVILFFRGVFKKISLPNFPTPTHSQSEAPKSTKSENTPVKKENKSASQATQKTAGSHTIYLPASRLNESTVQKLIVMYQAGYINSVATDLKNEDGTLNYPSKISDLANASVPVTTETADTLPRRINELKKAGISVIGRIACFDDDTFPRIRKDAAITTKNDYIWLDYHKTRHLNPYSDTAMNYLSQMIGEAADLGCTEVILTDFSFPTQGRTSYINYGDQALSKSEILSKRLQELVDAGEKNKIKVSLYLKEPAANGGTDKDSGQDTASFYRIVSHLYVSLSTQSATGESQLQNVISPITGDTKKLVPVYQDPAAFNTRFTKQSSPDSYYFDTERNDYSLNNLGS